MQYPSNKKYLVFDLDNTLILRDDAMVDCIQSIFKIPLSNLQRNRIKEKDQAGYFPRLQFCQWLKTYLNIPMSKNQIWDLIKKNIGFYVSLNQNAKMILQILQEKYELVLLTNGGIENQNRKIQQTGLNEFFPSDRIFISQEIGYSKPDPKIFQFVENQLGKNYHYCMIGDQFENDILGAKKIGWQTIYLRPENEYSKKEEVFYISSLNDLNKALNDLKY